MGHRMKPPQPRGQEAAAIMAFDLNVSLWTGARISKPEFVRRIIAASASAAQTNDERIVACALRICACLQKDPNDNGVRVNKATHSTKIFWLELAELKRLSRKRRAKGRR